MDFRQQLVLILMLTILNVCLFQSSWAQTLDFIYPSKMPPPFDRPQDFPDPIEQLKEWAAQGKTSSFSADFFTFDLDDKENILYVTVPIAISYFDYTKDEFVAESDAPAKFKAKRVATMLDKTYNYHANEIGVHFKFDIAWLTDPREEFHYENQPERFNILLTQPDDPIWRNAGIHFVSTNKLTKKQKVAPRAHASMDKPTNYEPYCNFKKNLAPETQAQIEQWRKEAESDPSVKIVTIPPIPKKLCEISAWSLLPITTNQSTIAHEAVHFVFGNTDSYKESFGWPLPALQMFLSSRSLGFVQTVEILTFLLKRGYMPPGWEDYVDNLKPKKDKYYQDRTRQEHEKYRRR